MNTARSYLQWLGLLLLVAVPVTIAATSPLLEWRQPVYIAAGLAGVFALVIMLFQPMLAAGLIAGVSMVRGRRWHRITGGLLLLLVLLHVVGLWITSPPDVIDALLFQSPTPFSVWGVIAMWALLISALLVVLRKRIALRPAVWRVVHKTLAVVIVAGTVVHAMLIDGAMGYWSKLVLCTCVTGVCIAVLWGRRVLR
jgi:predicted ferric reductase